MPALSLEAIVGFPDICLGFGLEAIMFVGPETAIREVTGR